LSAGDGGKEKNRQKRCIRRIEGRERKREKEKEKKTDTYVYLERN
jgi:hypothetical protein